MVRMKFCGMTRPVDAAFAGELGASYVGAVFAESPRRVTVAEAREIFAGASGVRRVGVFGHATISSPEIIRAARELRLDVMQLHGCFAPDEVARLRDYFDGEMWAVLAVEESRVTFPEDWEMIADAADAIVFDTSVRGASGGTGRVFDWTAAAPAIKRAASQATIVLAGGLNPANVATGIRLLHPAIVDVSSGVESSPGIKDHGLMRAFADAVVSASIV